MFEEPTVPPLSTVRVCVAGLPPSALNVTVQVHFAYTVIFPVTVVKAVNCVPLPPVAVYHPPKVLPLLAGSAGIFEKPTASPLFTVRVCVAGLPPSVLNVTVHVHFAYTLIFAVTGVEAVN
jgi:hypothetical protein